MGKVRLRDLNPAIFLHKVGIGTDNPAELLDVVGGNVRIGKTTNGRLTIENSSGTVKVQLDSNGNSYINGGNVGIGTANITHQLTIGDASPTIKLFDSTNDCSLLIYSQDNNAAFGTYSNHPIWFFANSNHCMTLSADGKLGIGTGSSTPVGLLEVKSTTTNSDIVINAFTGKDARLYFQENSSSIFKIYTDGSETNNPLKIYDYASATDVLTINNGKVGINSTNPNARLVVAGNSDAGDSTCAIHIIDNDSTGGSSTPNISFRSGASTQIYGIRANDVLGLTFRNSSDATKICFDDDGNIGVGIHENISAKLQVEGGRIKVRQSDSYSGFSIAHESGGHAYLINSDDTYMTFMVGGSASSNQILTLQDSGIDLNREVHFKNGTRRLHPRNGSHPIIETVFNLNNHSSDAGRAFNIADITRDTNNWGYAHYIVEVHANYYTGGSYARYYIIYAGSNSEVKTIDSAVGANTGYNVYLAGETTLSGNVKKASIMVDVPAYGNATIKLTHVGVSVDSGSLSHLSGHIKYNI